MRRILVCGFLVLILIPWLAHAQDATTAATGTKSPEESGGVQVGAGSRGDVTTGSSGSQGAENPIVAPEAPGFALAPPSHPFLGPGMLEVRTPERRRCELIGHENARRRCEAQAARPN
jgi:hypothetical protein